MITVVVSPRSSLWLLFGLALLTTSCQEQPAITLTTAAATNIQTFSVRGVVRELKADNHTVIIRHEEITNFMEAMTMPFRARQTNELSGLRPGDAIAFRLNVTDDASWIDHVTRTGHSPKTNAAPPAADSTNLPKDFRLADIPDFALTNEFGRAISLHQFDGRAVALTFFFTRCPIPEYCPRLTKNFQGAIEKLKAMPGGPTNFHFLSISFDPIDTPAVLRGYGRRYRYDSNYWSFVTGNIEQIRELARGFGVPVTPEGPTINHGFRTAVFDTAGHLSTIWPVGGDMTDTIVSEIVNAARSRPEPEPKPAPSLK
jgi:protein SCO1/2